MNSIIIPPNDNLGVFFTMNRSVTVPALLFVENSSASLKNLSKLDMVFGMPNRAYSKYRYFTEQFDDTTNT
jgi:hypothetical protein